MQLLISCFDPCHRVMSSLQTRWVQHGAASVGKWLSVALERKTPLIQLKHCLLSQNVVLITDEKEKGTASRETTTIKIKNFVKEQEYKIQKQMYQKSKQWKECISMFLFFFKKKRTPRFYKYQNVWCDPDASQLFTCIQKLCSHPARVLTVHLHDNQHTETCPTRYLQTRASVSKS